MRDDLRICLISLMLFLGAPAALGDATREIVESSNAALQQNVFELRRIPRECKGVAPDETCWEVYPTAWRSFSKEKKGINLVIKLWESNTARNTTDSDLKLTFVVDNKVIERKGVHFQAGDHSFEGVTATLNDEQLVRSLADGVQVWLGAGSDAWYATHLDPRIRLKFTEEMLTGIEAVLNKYDSLDSIQTRLQHLNSKRLEDLNEQLSGLTQQLQTSVKSWKALAVRDKECNAAGCLNEDKAAATAVLECGQSISKLLDERITLLAMQPQDAVTLEDERQSIQNRDKTRVLVNKSKAVVNVIDKKIAQAKGANPATHSRTD